MRPIGTRANDSIFIRHLDGRRSPLLICAGIVLQRLPIFCPQVSDFDKLYYRYRAIEDLKSPRKMLDVYNPKPIDEEERIFRQRRGLLEYEEEFSPIAGSLRDSPPAQDTTVQDLRREPFKTLHLVVKRTEDDPWDLPFAPLLKSEYLHTGAQRMIDSLVDTEKHGVCLIGRVPILHYEVKSARAKVFVMKGRFTRDPGTSKEQVIRDCHGYAFLTTGELRDTLPQERYEQLKNLVAIE